MKNILKRALSICTCVALMATMFVSTASSASAISYSGSSSYKSGKYYTALKNVKKTGNQRTDIVNVAKSQIGYQEGSSSSKLSGEIRGNGNCTEYGRWYGLQDMWCAMFVSWCANVAGVSTSVVPKHCYTPSGLSWFKSRGLAYSRATVANGGYKPQPGDIIYFKSSRNNNTTNHIGIVTKYSGSTVYTVEGNTSSATVSTNGGAVASKSYSIYNTYIVYICKPKYSGTNITTSSSSSSAKCFPACSSSCDSIVEGLNEIGVDSSKAYRTVIAEANGISNYSGTASQNIELLSLLKFGELINPDASSSSSSSSTSSAGRKKATAAQMAVMRKIIYAVETGGQVYGRADYSDFTEAYTNSSEEHAITIGAGQWYATEAKTLLNNIRKKAPSTFKSLDTAGIASDLDNKNWSTYRISKTSAKAKCIVKIISTDIGKQCQDALLDEQMESYMDYAYSLGVTDIDAQMMCANFRHQGGTGAVKRILGKTSKPYTLDKLYASCKTDTGNQVGAYKSRQKMVYDSLKKYIKNSEATTTTGSSTSEPVVETTSNPDSDYFTISSANKKYVFNATYYANKYSDLKKAFGTDSNALYEHFLENGVHEGRCASPNFDVKYYLEHSSNKDLPKAFGNKNYGAAIEHYLDYGMKEGRPSHPTFHVKDYRALYSDLQKAFGTNYKSLTNHYIDCGISEGRVGIKGITLNKTSVSLTETKSYTLKATVNGTGTVTWSSSNKAVATVTSAGVVKGVKAGTATITAKLSDTMKATCKVTVKAATVTFDKSTLTLTETKSATIKATVTAGTATWKSSNTAVATVTSAGEVKAVKAGTATITAILTNGAKATCKVTVNAATVTFDKTTLSVVETKTATIKATVTAGTATWKSSNTAVAKISSSGKVTAVAPGTATITATLTNGAKATCKVTVKAATVTLNVTSKSVTKGKTYTLKATLTGGEIKSWATSNSAVATVTTAGVVKGVKAGTATITVTLTNGNKATCKITVKNPAKYFSKCSASEDSIVDGLNSIGVNSSKTNRTKIAKANGISDYTGTASQNTKLLKLLKDGKLVNPGTAYYKACSSSKQSIVDALESINVDSSKTFRTKIAKKNGISDYTGTAAQNTKLLKLLKDGKLLVP